jgi:hypothetical protein
MKEINKSLLWMSLALLLPALQSSVYGQDDLYYETPTKTRPTTTEYVDDNNQPSNVTKRYDNDDAYYEDDDYAYEYSSRIRRFHRPATTVNYYDPAYVDLYNYDPYYLPGATIYTYGYNDYWTWRRWNRWNRWNRWSFVDFGWGYNSWGYNSWGLGVGYSPFGYGGFGGFGGYGYNSWNNPYIFNNYYYDPYWTWNGYNPYYCQNNYYYGGNHYYNDGNNNNGNGGHNSQTYTGVRRNGTNINPGYARINGNDRLSAPVKANTPSLDLNNRPNGRSAIQTANVPGTSDRGGLNGGGVPGNNGRTPNATTPNGRDNTTPTSRQADISRRMQDGGRNTDNTNNGNTGRNQDVAPTRRADPANDRLTRPSGNNGRSDNYQRSEPARERTVRPSTGTQDNTPSRRFDSSNESRPSRSNDSEARPSRSESSGRSIDSGSSRSSGGNSGGSSGGNSGGGGRSGGGSGGGRSGGGRH